MAPPLKQQLPRDLAEEILSRLPLQALVRCRSVCKEWNSLFNDKSFLKNYSSRFSPQFILLTASKVYSIDVVGCFDPSSIINDPKKIESCELPFSCIPFGSRYLKSETITSCDEFLFYNSNWYWKNQTAFWNPLLRQVTRTDNKDTMFQVVGLGYDNSRPEKVYKMLVWYWDDHRRQRLAMYDPASHAFKSIDTPDHDWPICTEKQVYVPLNGNLYWVDYNHKTREYFIQSFDFSSESFKPLCLLPCQHKHGSDKLSNKLHLAVFEGDRFSLLKLSHEPRKTGVWVTKKRIRDDGEGVVWINFMTFSATNFPTLSDLFYHPVSYFIYNKTVFICCGGDGVNAGGIYIFKEDLCKEIPIGSGQVNFCHCVYTPSLISLPSFIYKLD